MNEVAHELALRAQEAHKNYIFWYRGLRTSNDGLGLHQVTEQFSMMMRDTFSPRELYDIIPKESEEYKRVVKTLPRWAKAGLQDVISYRKRSMALCFDDWGQQNAIIYNGQAHCWPDIYDCFASIDTVIDHEIYCLTDEED